MHTETSNKFSSFDFRFGTFLHNTANQPNATIASPTVSTSYSMPVFPVVSNSRINVNKPIEPLKQKMKSNKKVQTSSAQKKQRKIKYKVEI